MGGGIVARVGYSGVAQVSVLTFCTQQDMHGFTDTCLSGYTENSCPCLMHICPTQISHLNLSYYRLAGTLLKPLFEKTVLNVSVADLQNTKEYNYYSL